MVIFEADLQGRVTFSNRLGFEWFGYSKKDFEAGMNVVEMLAQEDRLRAKETIQRVLKGEVLPYREYTARRKDGRTFSALVTTRAVFKNDQVVGFVGAIMDFSDHRQAEEKLRENEHRYRTLFESAGDAIFLMDREHFVDCNQQTLTMFAVERQGIIGRSPIDFSPPLQPDGRKSSEKAREKIAAAFAGRSQFFEWTHTRADGTPFAAEVRLNRVELGSDYFLQAIVRDISERVKAAESILTLSQVVEQSPAAIILMDPRGKIEFVNPGYTKMTGFTRDEIVGQDIGQIVSSKEDSEVKRQILRRLEKGEVWTGEFSNRKKDGGLFWGSVLVSPIWDFKGSIRRLAVIVQEITEQKKLELHLRQAQKMEAIGVLAGGVAHDFNNFLSAIVGMASLLEIKTEEDSLAHQYAGQILEVSERAASLTQSLLSFSRQQLVDLRLTNLNELIVGFHKILGRLIGEDIEFALDLSAEPLMIRADKGGMEQVLMNLVTNARDAMPEGGNLTITTSRRAVGEAGKTEDHPEMAVMEIMDSGIGISEEMKSRIFEPFFSNKETGKGTGLGLAIVYGIVQQHGGTIEVENDPGGGTLFRLFFPLQEAADEREAISRLPQLMGGTETILVVEDDPVVRQVIRDILEAYGYQVLEAVDGSEAAPVFRENSKRIGLVICDWIMPKKKGREVFAEIRAISATIPFLFISGYPGSYIFEKEGFGEPATFLAKPVNPNELLTRIRVVLDGQKGKSQ